MPRVTIDCMKALPRVCVLSGVTAGVEYHRVGFNRRCASQAQGVTLQQRAIDVGVAVALSALTAPIGGGAVMVQRFDPRQRDFDLSLPLSPAAWQAWEAGERPIRVTRFGHPILELEIPSEAAADAIREKRRDERSERQGRLREHADAKARERERVAREPAEPEELEVAFEAQPLVPLGASAWWRQGNERSWRPAIVFLAILALIGALAGAVVGGIELRDAYRASQLAPFEAHVAEWSSKSAWKDFKRDEARAAVTGKVMVLSVYGTPRLDRLVFSLPPELRAEKPEDVGTLLWLQRSGESCMAIVVERAPHRVLAYRNFTGEHRDDEVVAWVASLPRR
jgi:hypothetical protein